MKRSHRDDNDLPSERQGFARPAIRAGSTRPCGRRQILPPALLNTTEREPNINPIIGRFPGERRNPIRQGQVEPRPPRRGSMEWPGLVAESSCDYDDHALPKDLVTGTMHK